MSSVKIQIYDGFTPLLDKIATLSYGLGMDALDQSANTIRKSIRNQMELSSRHLWSQSVVNGKRRIHRGVTAKRPGSNMMNHKTGGPYRPNHMKNFITSWVSERHMVAVVGGMHKAYRPKLRRNGKVVGTGRKVGGVSEATYGILKKLNDGNANDSSYKKARPSSMPGFKNAKYKKRNFVEKGRTIAIPRVKQIMGDKLEMLIAKQVNRANIKGRMVS